MIQVEIDSEQVQTLERYCLRSPTEVPILIDRIVREWYSKAAKAMYRGKVTMPKFQHVPEHRITKVGINTEHGKIYKYTLRKMGLNEADLTTYLVGVFIQVYKIKQKGRKEIRKW